MPRAHTDAERQQIHQRLVEVGRDRFVRFGLHKTTVADLARGAGIGKGSFYQFFASKEELFMAVQEREEAAFKAGLIAEVDAAGNGRGAVVALLTCVTSRIDRHPFLRALLEPEVMQALTLRLPAERVEAHRQADRAFFLGLTEDWKERGWLRDDVATEVVFDVLAAMFAVSLQRELIGVDSADRAVREIAEAVADRWCVSN